MKGSRQAHLECSPQLLWSAAHRPRLLQAGLTPPHSLTPAPCLPTLPIPTTPLSPSSPPSAATRFPLAVTPHSPSGIATPSKALSTAACWKSPPTAAQHGLISDRTSPPVDTPQP